MAQPINQLKQVRLQKLEEIRKLGINPYPARCLRKQTTAQVLKMMGKKVGDKVKFSAPAGEIIYTIVKID